MSLSKKYSSTHTTHPEYKTIRQWALAGYLPKHDAQGVELWANCFCQDKFIYYSPEEVEPASPERLREYFAPEREKKNRRARAQREQLRAQREREARYQTEHNAREQTRAAILPCVTELSRLYAEKPRALDGLIILDTETTGLDSSEDEVLQLSIIDGNGTELYNRYFRPCAEEWKDAQRVNHISPDDVKEAPRISEELPTISTILARAHTLIGYNLGFDLDFLTAAGTVIPESAERIDVMKMFASVYGEWSDYHGGYKWQKLTTAAAFYEYEWKGAAHDSLADCKATLYVYNKLLETETKGKGVL